MKININDSVRVVLTGYGAELYNKFFAQFNYPASYDFKTYKSGEVLKTQLWCIMEIFGSNTHLGMKGIFEDNIIELEGK